MNKCIFVKNKDGKIWVFPTRNIKTAICIYQPSSTKGIVLKKIIPLLVKIGMCSIFKKFGLEEIDYDLSNEIKEYLFSIYGSDHIQFSVFYGTPGTQQKTTIQIFNGDSILGYCKITESIELYEVFQKEDKILKYLAEKNVSNVPISKGCNDINGKIFVFVQSTNKLLNSTEHHSLGTLELEFLKVLYEKTVQNITFYQSDFFSSISFLRDNIQLLVKYGFSAKVFEKSISIITSHYKSKYTYSVIHRDFTPWNMYCSESKLYVFDFEYAKYTYPPYIDIVHYLSQTNIFEKKMDPNNNVEKILGEMEKIKSQIAVDNVDVLIISYLIDIISLYIEREHRLLSNETLDKINYWYKMLLVVHQELEKEL